MTSGIVMLGARFGLVDLTGEPTVMLQRPHRRTYP